MVLVKQLLYYIFVPFLVSAASLQAAFGGNSALFLAEPLNVRPMGMAGAFASQADDESSIQSNPAGLSRIKGFSVGGGQLIGLLGLNATQATLALNLAPKTALGLQLAYLHDSDVLRDAAGNELGSFENSNLLGILGLGTSFARGWRLGAALKALKESYASSESFALAGDLGLQASFPRGFRAGISAQNLGAQLQGGGAPLPLRIQGGLSLPLFISNWRLNAELQGLPSQGQLRGILGSELSLELSPGPGAVRAALRGGYAAGMLFGEPARASLGAGLELEPTYALDYAIVAVGSLGNLHRVSLTLRFPGGASSQALLAPRGLKAVPQAGGIAILWTDPNPVAVPCNLYADYGVMIDRINVQPVKGEAQRLVKVDKGRVYHFYLKPVGPDGKEGPSSEVLEVAP
jgi:hypothetical protein